MRRIQQQLHKSGCIVAPLLTLRPEAEQLLKLIHNNEQIVGSRQTRFRNSAHQSEPAAPQRDIHQDLCRFG